MEKKTPLYDTHVKYGGKIVEFGGFLLPVQYGSGVKAEHMAVRTQAGLLECMEERQVTIDGETYTPGNPFFVMATQNPVETTGTFPLPEAQLDRFMMRLSMGLPSREEELEILSTSVNPVRLKNNPVELCMEAIYRLYAKMLV